VLGSWRAKSGLELTSEPAVGITVSLGGTLYDVVLEPSLPIHPANPDHGCLIVTDDQRREIYAIEVRDPSDAKPTQTLIASGFCDPRGLAFYGGFLYVAEHGDDAIIRISPSANPSDCF
jgi:hypothetical protein